jgi:hypothetical protein
LSDAVVMTQSFSEYFSATVQTAAIRGGATGGGIGLLLSIVAAIARGPVPAAVVIAAMGAVLMITGGAVIGAMIGAVLGSTYAGASTLIRVAQTQLGIARERAMPIDQLVIHPIQTLERVEGLDAPNRKATRLH